LRSNEIPKKLIDEKGYRIDGRKAEDLRPIAFKVGILNNANGSAYVEFGGNKIVVGVYGPREAHPRRLILPDRAIIRSRYRMAPFSVDERKNPAPSRREIEISKVIREALEPAIMSEYYPRTTIDIFIEVLQSDGGSRCASIVGASLALADAGIPMRDLVSACSVGKAEGKMILDLSDLEDKYGEVDMPVAFMPNFNCITLLQMDGEMILDEFNKGLDMAINACKKIHKMQEEALKHKYQKIQEKGEE
jgi:exosome complex component RRP41